MAIKTRLSTVTAVIATIAVIAAVGSLGGAGQQQIALAIPAQELDLSPLTEELDEVGDVISNVCDFAEERPAACDVQPSAVLRELCESVVPPIRC